MNYTRSGNTFTVSRGGYGTEAKEHRIVASVQA